MYTENVQSYLNNMDNDNLTDNELLELWVKGELVLSDTPVPYTEEEIEQIKEFWNNITN